jgi:hypothetical protein
MKMEQNISDQLIASEGIFLRMADRTRFDYVMRAIQENSQSVAISSDSDDVLDHYGRIVINQLRQLPDLQIEVFLPANTEALLERFNQILSGLSLTDARDAESSPAPRRVLIAHDAKAINARELQLLARLIQDFPGANTSLVLLLDQSGSRQHERSLENFGQRLLRWPLEKPTREEGDVLLAQARMRGLEVEVKKLLAATGFLKQEKTLDELVAPAIEKNEEAPLFTKPSSNKRKATVKDSSGRTEPVLNDIKPTSSKSTSKVVAPAKPVNEGNLQTAQGPSFLSRTLNMTVRWIAAIVLLMVVSVGVIALLFPQKLLPRLADSPILKENLPPWMMTLLIDYLPKSSLPAAAPESTESPPAPLPIPAALPIPEPVPASVPANINEEKKPETTVPATSSDSSVKTDVASKNEPVKPESKEVKKPLKSAPSSETVVPMAPVAKIESVLPTKTPKTDTAAKSVKQESDRQTAEAVMTANSERGVTQLVQSAKAGSFFVQHVSLLSMAEAQEWRAQHAALSGSVIAAVNTQKQGIKFVVLSGPFSDRTQAEQFANSPGVPKDSWLRPLASLRQALQDLRP